MSTGVYAIDSHNSVSGASACCRPQPTARIWLWNILLLETRQDGRHRFPQLKFGAKKTDSSSRSSVITLASQYSALVLISARRWAGTLKPNIRSFAMFQSSARYHSSGRSGLLVATTKSSIGSRATKATMSVIDDGG